MASHAATIIIILLLSLAATSCATTDSAPKATTPVASQVEPPEEATIAGQPAAWPPKGPGCKALVACCQALIDLDASFDLACKLSTSPERPDCQKAITTMQGMAQEQGKSVPPACQPTKK